MNNHVSSLSWSKKLKEAGFPQESKFWWWMSYNDKKAELIDKKKDIGFGGYKLYSAPLATEILERLPHEIERGEFIYALRIMRAKDNNYIVQYSAGFNEELLFMENENLCNALAEIYCYLADNNLGERCNDG